MIICGGVKPLKIAEVKELGRIIAFLEEYIDHCVYIYIDIVKYGLTHEHIKLWYTERGCKINTVAMKYYDSFQLFSVDVMLDKDKVCTLLRDNPVKTISGNYELIEVLAKNMQDEYEINYGVIVKEDKYREVPGFEKVEAATEKDCYEIAQLMCQDREFNSNYEVDILAEQLANRIKTGVGRSYIIREQEQIVAHVGVFAEAGNVVVESGLIADARYRNRFYGLIIHECLMKILLSEGKKVYGFRIKEEMKNCTFATDEKVCGYYGKMTRRI